MRKILAVIVVALTLVFFTGCGVTSSLNTWGTDTYEHNGHTYLVFTTGEGSIFVIEEE